VRDSSPDWPIIIETDASDYALAAILSIVAEDGELHPVAFHSQSFSPTELVAEGRCSARQNESPLSWVSHL